MNAIHETNQSKKDLIDAKIQGKQIEKLKGIVRCLSERIGLLKGSRDCPIEPDGLLIYRTDGDFSWTHRQPQGLFKKYKSQPGSLVPSKLIVRASVKRVR